MSIEEIRSLRNAKALAPFDVVFGDGRTVHVAAPERIAIAPWGRLGIWWKNVLYSPRVEDVSATRNAARDLRERE